MDIIGCVNSHSRVQHTADAVLLAGPGDSRGIHSEDLLAFAMEEGYFDEAVPPRADSDDLNVWRDLIEELDQTLLWDNDYAMDPADSWDPTEDNYYRSDTPNPSNERLALILEDLGDLLPEADR